MTIKSDLKEAQTYATAFHNVADSLLEQKPVTHDTQTTLAGNTNAQDAFQQAITTAKEISTIVNDAGVHLHSVAKDFEAFDQEVKISFFSKPVGGKKNG